MYIYEKVRARNFARAWGFAQASMAIPNAIGIPALGKNDFLFIEKFRKNSMAIYFCKQRKFTFFSRRDVGRII